MLPRLLIAVLVWVSAAAVSVAADPKPVLICFTWSACPNCPAMFPIWDAAERAGYKVHRIDVMKQADLANNWKVTAVPATIAAIMKDDGTAAEVNRLVGVKTVAEVEALIRTASPPAP
jgi:thioredoxin-like negative regulator of GroEL